MLYSFMTWNGHIKDPIFYSPVTQVHVDGHTEAFEAITGHVALERSQIGQLQSRFEPTYCKFSVQHTKISKEVKRGDIFTKHPSKVTG